MLGYEDMRFSDVITDRDGHKTLIVLSKKFGSFDWPKNIRYDEIFWSFQSQECMTSEEATSGQFGGKAIYRLLIEVAAKEDNTLNQDQTKLKVGCPKCKSEKLYFHHDGNCISFTDWTCSRVATCPACGHKFEVAAKVTGPIQFVELTF